MVRLTTFIKTLAITLMTIAPTSVYGSSCCLCGTNDVGSCVSWDTSLSNHVFMEGTKHDGSSWKCGDDHSTLGPGPCGIVQANAFGSNGCGCAEDNRAVVSTPPCVACDVEDLNYLEDGNGNERWFVFTAGALTCSDIMGFALQGFIPESMCDVTINEMAEFGCCGSTSSGSNNVVVQETATEPEPQACGDNLPDCPSGLTCDTRSNTCSDYLSRAKRTRSKRLCRNDRGGSRAGC